LPHYEAAAGIHFSSAQEALAHYRELGRRQGLDPHPLFDGAYYVDCHPEAAGSLDPFSHYVDYGAARGYDPGPYFDAAYYAQRARLGRGANVLLDYVERGWSRKARDPNPLFSSAYYTAVVPSPVRGSETPLGHFLREGIFRRCAASPVHAAMLEGAGLRSAPLLRKPGARPHVVFLWSGSSGAEIALRAGEVLEQDHGLGRIAVFLEGGAAPDRGVLALQDFADTGSLSRPSGLRLLVRSLAAAWPPFAFTDAPGHLLTLRLLGVPAVLVVFDDVAVPSEADAAAAAKVVFTSRDLLALASESEEPLPPNVALRPYEPEPAAGDRASGYVRVLVELAVRESAAGSEARGRRPGGLRPRTRKVLVLCSDWSLSGVNTTIEAIGGELRRLDWDVELLFTRSRAFVEASAAGGAHMPRLPHRYLHVDGGDAEALWEALRSEIEREAPCIVLTEYDFLGNSVVPALSDAVGVVLWLQADEIDYYEQAYRLGRYANALVCVSNRIKKIVAELNPLIGERACVIHNATVPERAIAKASDCDRELVRIIYAGRLVQYQKRVLDFVRLADALADRDVPFSLTLAGALSPHDQASAVLPRIAARHVDEGTIRIAERLSRKELEDEFARHDFFVLLSEFEGLPLSLLEAMAAGCVPVAPEGVSGVNEVVRPGANGLLVSTRDYGIWANAIAETWRDLPRLRALSAGARATVRARFTVEQAAAAFDTLLADVAEQITAGTYRRAPTLTWGRGRASVGDVLPPPSIDPGARVAGLRGDAKRGPRRLGTRGRERQDDRRRS
jgi:glycosyltransferase involved in cell wall biosynthesis